MNRARAAVAESTRRVAARDAHALSARPQGHERLEHCHKLWHVVARLGLNSLESE
jgi:hypothetical protein